MMTVRGRSLPTHVSMYRATQDGEVGVVVNVEGRSAFLSREACAQMGFYLLADEPPTDTGEHVILDDGRSQR